MPKSFKEIQEDLRKVLNPSVQISDVVMIRDNQRVYMAEYADDFKIIDGQAVMVFNVYDRQIPTRKREKADTKTKAKSK